MFDCQKCDKMSSQIECLKILKVAFTIVGINERFVLTALKEILEACYSMTISREEEHGKKMLKTAIEVTFNIEDRTVESMQRLS